MWQEDAELQRYDNINMETKQLDYYVNLNTSLSNITGAVKQYENRNWLWWLRSAGNYNSLYFVIVSNSGKIATADAKQNIIGVSPAFRIA